MKRPHVTRRAVLAAAATAPLMPRLSGSDALAKTAGDAALANLKDALARSNSGRIVVPGQPEHARVKYYNARFDCVRTKAIVQPKSTAGVVEFVRWAMANNRQFAIRGAGHSFEGKSSHPDLVIDLSQMRGLVVNADGTLDVEAGTLLGEIYDRLSPLQRVLPAGTCPTVGAVGHALGGGIGDYLPMYGYCAQSLTEAELVTLSGQVVRVNSSGITSDGPPLSMSGADLLKLLRGAGQGSVGIVTRMKFKTHDVSKAQLASFKIDASGSAPRAVAIIEAWQRWRSTQSPALKSVVSAKMNLGRTGNSYGCDILGLIAIQPGSPVTMADVKRSLDGLASLPELSKLQFRPKLDAAGAVKTFIDDDETSYNTKRKALYGASSALPAALPRPAIEHLIRALSPSIYVSLYTSGGVSSAVEETSLHPSEFIFEWSTYGARDPENHRRVAQLRADTMRRAGFGDDLGFHNYPDALDRNYFPDRARLQTLAATLDPQGLSTSSLLRRTPFAAGDGC